MSDVQIPTTFVLSRATRSVTAYGVAAAFPQVDDAVAAARAGRCVVGAIPFTDGAPAALFTPHSVVTHDTALAATPPPTRTFVTIAQTPAPDVHRDRVADVVEMIAAGKAEKVVLARSVTLRCTAPLEPSELIANFAAGSPQRNAFGVDLSSSGSADFDGHWFLGSTPELLIRKDGRTVTCHPYAGSAARQSDPAADAEAGRALLNSAKDRAEHAFVVDYLRTELGPFCSELSAPDQPTLLATNEVWHLATPISGVLADTDTTVLDLAVALTPTPAVGGSPRAAATAIIEDVEEPRRFYAGAIGWCDEHGDGEWMVSIRCLELDADRVTVQTWAGGGIVAASDPQAELDETTAKLQTVLRALGTHLR